MDRRKTKKRIKQENAHAMDRISELSDDILASIISKLSLDEALSTSLLSKRWRYIWTFTSGSLNFDSSLLENFTNVKTLASNLKKYTEWINQVLELHRSSTITEFSVYSCSDVIYKSCIDKWFDFAISKNAQIFELDFSASAAQYTQTSKRYYISTLQSCFSSFKSLRSFTLKNVDVDGDTLEFILSNCPFLERLSVNESGKLEALNVHGSSLQLMHLELTCCKFLKKIEISAPKLVSFNYFGSNFQLNVESAPLLVDVSIGEDCPTRSIITSSFHMLRSYLSQLETLTLDFSQQIQVPELELTNLRHLVIGGQLLHFENLLGVISIINDSPFLQRFELELQYKKSYLQLKRSYLQNGRRSMLTLPKCTHQHLKIVELKNFTGQALDLDLAIYLLENASMLEKMIIGHERKLFARLKIEQLKTKLPPGAELIIDSN